MESSSTTSTITMTKYDVQTDNKVSSRRGSVFSSDYCKELYAPNNNIKDGSCFDDVRSFPKKDTVASLSGEPSKDKWHALQIILLIQGLATTLPWNMFINAQPYFQDYKLKITLNSTDMERHYQKSFMSYVTICSMIPSVLLSAINVFITKSKIASPMRMIVAKLVIITLLVITIALAAIDTSEYVGTFFIVTMVIIIFTNGASAIYSNNLFGICSILPKRFITTVIYGTNIAGVLTSISSIISIAISSIATSALFYFSSAVFVVIIALITNQILQRSPLYVYCTNNIENGPDQPEKQSTCPQVWKIFKKIWSVCFNIWLIVIVTTVNFPNVASQVNRRNIPIDDIYWTPVFCFLNYNIFNLLGSVPLNWTVWPGPKRMWIVVLLRTLILGPFFILINYLPDEGVIPAYFANDYAFIFAVGILGLSNTYMINNYFIYTPSLLDEEEVAVGGMILNIFLFLGMFSGGLISFATNPSVKYSWG